MYDIWLSLPSCSELYEARDARREANEGERVDEIGRPVTMGFVIFIVKSPFRTHIPVCAQYYILYFMIRFEPSKIHHVQYLAVQLQINDFRGLSFPKPYQSIPSQHLRILCQPNHPLQS